MNKYPLTEIVVPIAIVSNISNMNMVYSNKVYISQ